MQVNEANSSTTTVEIGDYVYFRHGDNYNDYPLGVITEITSNNKYKIKYGNHEYECKSNEIYKTNGKKPSVPDYNIETIFEDNDNLNLEM